MSWATSSKSLGSMAMLFLFGVGLIYLLLGAQFSSYTQPLIVMSTVPMAFVGVVFGLGLSGNPMSLFTLYGVVALVRIAANDSIVLISAANNNLIRSRSVSCSVALAARRRFLPIVIKSTTTIAGFFSLAVGLSGRSFMWGPVATAIVWGLVFSTLSDSIYRSGYLRPNCSPSTAGVIRGRWAAFAPVDRGVRRYWTIAVDS